jgi:long-chain acyl-CoA synthetase
VDKLGTSTQTVKTSGPSVSLSEKALLRVIKSLVYSSIAPMRKTPCTPGAPAVWTEQTSLRSGGLGLDSYELLNAAVRVIRFFGLDNSGYEDYLLRRSSLGGWVEVVGSGFDGRFTGFTFHSSGSTGTPKAVYHTLPRLMAEAGFIQTLFPDVRTVCAAVPACHVYGFVHTVLLPETAEWDVIEFTGDLAQCRDDNVLFVSHPLTWEAVLQKSDSGIGTHKIFYGLSSTSALPDRVWKSLSDQGMARMVEVYGATETGGVGYRISSGEPFTLFPHYARSRIKEDLSEDNLSGTIVSGATVSEEAVCLKRVLSNDDEACRPMDHLIWYDETTFRPMGRTDEGVKIGDKTVYPRRIEEKLRQMPLVRKAAIRSDGDRLKAFIVPEDNIEIDSAFRQKIQTWVQNNLPGEERPVRLTFGSKLPLNDIGKISDW